jgi:methionyl-tRNA formyltransferase
MPGLDTGPMLLKYETPIGPDETARRAVARLAEAGAPLIVETLARFASGAIARAAG